MLQHRNAAYHANHIWTLKVALSIVNPLQLATNDGSHHLHGGRKGWDKKTWQGEEFKHSEGPAVKLTYTSKDGEEVNNTINVFLKFIPLLGYPLTAQTHVRPMQCFAVRRW